jgi:hypothetical protein
MKLFVWGDVLKDYTSGMVCVLAKNERQAWEKLYEADSTAWWVLQGEPCFNVPNESQGVSAFKFLASENKFCFDNAIRPKVVSEPEAFIVWGGG